MSKGPPPEGYDDNPEWTEEDFTRARPAADLHPAHVAATLVRKPMGRPRGSDKEQVTLRLDKAALDHFRAAGPGWQTRVNEAVRKAAGL